MNSKLTKLLGQFRQDYVLDAWFGIVSAAEIVTELQRRIEAELCVKEHELPMDESELTSTGHYRKANKCVNCGREKEK